MSRAPPPPVKKSGPRAPPPPKMPSKTFENTEPTKMGLNTLDQEQQRPEKISQLSPSTPAETHSQVKQIQTNNTQIPLPSQIQGVESKLQNQIQTNNFDQNIQVPAPQQKQISQNNFPNAKKIIPPVRKDMPPPNKKRAPAPPGFPKTISPLQVAQLPQNNTGTFNQIAPKQEVPSIQQQPVKIPTQTCNNSIQTQRDSIIQSATPINSDNSITSFSNNIPSPNIRVKSQIPPPPKQNTQKSLIVNKDRQQSEKQDFYQPNILPLIKVQQEKQKQKIKMVQTNLSATQKESSSPKVTEKKEELSGGKSKLQQKLQKLRQAKAEMTQQINQNQQQPPQDQQNEPITQNPQQFIEEEEIVRTKIDKIIQKNNNIKQVNNSSLPEQKLQQNSQDSFLSKNRLIQTKSDEILKQPPAPKFKYPQPPPPLERVQTTPQMPFPKNNKNKSQIPEKVLPKPIAKQQFQNNIQKQQNKSIKESIKEPSGNIQPKVHIQKPVEIELTLKHQKQNLSTIQIHNLLERYRILKQNYLSNIRQLEDQINFQKKRQQTEIQVINNIIAELGKKNKLIKQICGLKTPKISTSSPDQQQNLAV